MASDNVTPIYGEWVVKHLDYYMFRGENAYALKKELMSIDIDSSESDNALVDCYRRFVFLFVNNVYDTAFEQYDEGIMAMNSKGFLVNNQYNVWTPIGLMEENGRGGVLELDFDNSVANRKISEKVAEMTSVVKENKDKLDGLDAWPKKSKPSKIFAYGTMVLCLAVIVCFLVNWRMIPATDFQFPMVILWGGIALIMFVGAIKTIKEFEALRRWKNLKELEKWFEDFAAKENSNQSILMKYKIQLKTLAQDGSEFLIPKPSQSLNSYFSLLDGKSKALQNILKETGKLRKKTGGIMLFFLAAALVFITYGQSHWSLIDLLRQIEHSEDSGSVESSVTEESLTIPVLVTTNPVRVVDAEASSELTNTKGYTYSVSYSNDGDVNTCWQDGASGDGVGEILVYYFDQPKYIVGMDIINGRVDSEEKYYDNNRIESMTIYYFLDGGVTTNVVVDLDDVYNMEPVYYAFTDRVLDEAYYCEGVQIQIESVYAGDKYNDLCLTDIQFYEGIYE